MQCSCGHNSYGRCPGVDYSDQDALIDASLSRGEPESEVKTCPDCGDSWTADVPADACDCKTRVT